MIGQTNTDLAPCSNAASEAFQLYGLRTDGTITGFERANASQWLSQDIVACSFANAQVFDLSNPSQPVRLAQSRPQAVDPGARDPQLGATATLTWSYPIVRDGLIYVADINQGLSVLRYQGPHQDQLEHMAFAEGNSNLARLLPAPSPSSSPTPTARPSSSARAAPSASPAASRLGSVPTLALIVGALVGLLLLGAAAYLWQSRRPRGPVR